MQKSTLNRYIVVNWNFSLRLNTIGKLNTLHVYEEFDAVFSPLPPLTAYYNIIVAKEYAGGAQV